MVGHDDIEEKLVDELQQLKNDYQQSRESFEKEIEEYKKANAFFQQKITNCEAIFESSPVAMMIVDSTTNIVMVNLAAVKLCGGSEDEILQHRPGNALRCVHSHKDPRGCGYASTCKTCEVRNAIEALIANGGTINGAELELNLVNDGVPQKVWMNLGIEPVIKDDEKHWCIAMADVTERKLVEESLRISEERFRGIFNNLQDAFFQSDLMGGLVLVSPSALTMFGYNSVYEIVGKPVSLFLDEVQLRDFIKTELYANGIINDHVCLGKRKDGTTFWVSMNVQFRIQNGKISGTEGIVRDISYRKQAEEDLIKAKEKAEECDRLKTSFLANMSHEIRTPLNSIIGFSELLLDPDFGPDEQSDFVKLIQNNGRNLLTIISDIMDISKIETGQVPVSNESFSIQHLIEELGNEFYYKAEEKGLKFLMHVPQSEDPIMIYSDPNRMKQILTNLLNNSIKFTEEGCVELGVCEINNDVQIYIRDTGIGIPQQYHEKIFERFQQIEHAHTRKYGGNGLGLAISKQLSDLLNYNLWLESQPGEGSTFYLSALKVQ